MNNLQKKTFNIIIIFGLIAALVFIIGLFSKGDLNIDTYTADVTINDAGDMTVVETWDINYYTHMNVRFRDIAFNKYATDYELSESLNNIASFDTNHVSVKFFKDGQDRTNDVRVAYSFNNEYDELGGLITCEPNSSTCESIFVDATNAGGLDGNVSFEYTYTILGVITSYSDISELNWRLFDYAEDTVKQANITVTFPENAFSIEDMYVWGHGLTNGTITKSSNNQVVMDIGKIRSGEFPEFRILVQNDLFSNIEQKNVYITPKMTLAKIMDYEETISSEFNQRVIATRVILALTIVMCLVMGGVTYAVYRKYDKEYIPEYKGDYYRELPNEDTPAEVSYLYYMKKISNESVTATLLDLVRKKFITLDSTGKAMTSAKADFILTLDKTADKSKLKKHEIELLHWVFNIIGDGSVVTTKKIEKYGKSSVEEAKIFQSRSMSFIEAAKQVSSKHPYFEYNYQLNKKKIMVPIIIPIILLAISLITSSIYVITNWITTLTSILVIISYSTYVYSIKKRSVEGNELFTKWKAFKNFLINFSSIDDYPIPGVIVWEHYLVYATVLGIADKVMAQLEIKLPKEELASSSSTFMKVGYSSKGFYYGMIVNRFNTTFTNASSNSMRTIAVYNASKVSSGGGGGGFGGGSSGGGGGGGGRSR